MGSIVTFSYDGESASGYEAAPKSGKGFGVIVLQEYWGLVPHIQDVCDRFAAAGFVALAPDLYHGQIAKSPDEAGRLMMALNIDRTARDLGGAVARLANHPQIQNKRIGIVGFCLGGQLALYAASKYREITACVNFYGVHPNVRPDYSAIRCPVLGFFAEKDSFVTPQVARKLETDLNAGGVRTDFTIFPDVEHAFFNDARKEVYHPETAQKAWLRMIEFFKANLAPAAARTR